MLKLSRVLFAIFGILVPILIGALHTSVHFRELLTPEAKQLLSGTIPIMGRPTPLFNTWGLMSFMMGASFIIIGLLNGAMFCRLAKGVPPHLANILITSVYLAFVIYAGHTFHAVPQFYGGVVGFIAMLVALSAAVKGRA